MDKSVAELCCKQYEGFGKIWVANDFELLEKFNR